MAIHRFGEVTEKLRRSTVQVRSGRNGSGSGIIWNAGGQVITNAHVVRANDIQIELWNGRQLSARLLKKDQRRDLASLDTGERRVAQDLVAEVLGFLAGI